MKQSTRISLKVGTSNAFCIITYSIDRFVNSRLFRRYFTIDSVCSLSYTELKLFSNLCLKCLTTSVLPLLVEFSGDQKIPSISNL